jgi:outer membrane lipoprotein-sorting protein
MAWILVILLLLPTVAYAQLSAAEVLQRVTALYAGAQQFQFASRIVERRQGSETTGSDEIVADRHGRLWFRADGSLAAAESGGAEGTRLMVVADGRVVWVYLEGRQEYKRVEGTPDPRNRDSHDDSVDNPRSFARKLMDSSFVRYAKFQSMSDRAKLLREEACTLNGARSECYVVEINSESLAGTYTLWVDKRQYLVLRDDFRVVDSGRVAYENSILFDVAKMNTPIPNKRFSFVPPQGAKQVDSFF